MNYGKKGTSKKQKSLNSKSRKVKKKMGVTFFKAFLVCMIALGVVGFCAGIGVIKGVIDNAPDIDNNDVIPRGYKSIMYDAEGNEMTELIAEGSNRTPVSIENVPEFVQQAFIAIEDARFMEHNGIDIKGIIRAGVKGIANGFKFTEGASTITQQLLKNNVFDFMEENGFAEKLERKIQEQYLAIKLEEQMSKSEILEAYLNTINLGQNTLGIQAASNRYFNKDVSDLTLSEAAVLAAITKNPSSYNPIKNPDKNKERQGLVLSNMLEQGYITQSEYEDAKADDVYSRIQVVNEETDSNRSVNDYFTDEVIQQIMEDLKEYKGYTDTQAYNAVYSGGLRIYTTQDPKIQQIMNEELSNEENYPKNVKTGLEYALTVVKPDGTQTNYSKEMMEKYFKGLKGKSFDLVFDSEEEAQACIDEYKASLDIQEEDTVYESVNFTLQPQVSMVIMDQATGEVKALVGGRGEKKANLTLNRATDTVRQPGSTFKPIVVYAPALDSAGRTLASVQYDSPFKYEDSEKYVRNWDKSQPYYGWASYRRGIEQSMNVLAVKTITDITPALGFSYAENFGISTLIGETNEQGQSDIIQSLALGGITKGVTNLELTGAYATIANGGVYTEPVFYTRIEDKDGNVIMENEPQTRTVLKDSTAWLLTSALQGVVNGGTGGAVKFSGMPIAGKTGTTNNNVDLWFVGFTPYYTCGVWAGYDNNRSMSSKLGETNYHKKLWKQVMSRIHEELPSKDFVKPDNITSVAVCSKSGKLPIPGVCDTDPRGSMVRTEYFAQGTEPTEMCDVHVRTAICAETGLFATEFCPMEERTVVLIPDGVDLGTVTADSAYGVSSNLTLGTCTVHSGGIYVPSYYEMSYSPDYSGITGTE